MGSEAGDVAIKLGGQENGAAPAEEETGVCCHFPVDPIFQGVHWPLGPSLLSVSIPPPGLFSPACPPEAPLSPPSQFLEAPFATPVGSPTPYPPSVRNISRNPGDTLSGGPVPGMFLFPSGRPSLLPAASSAPRQPVLMQLTAGRGTRHPGTRAFRRPSRQEPPQWRS